MRGRLRDLFLVVRNQARQDWMSEVRARQDDVLFASDIQHERALASITVISLVMGMLSGTRPMKMSPETQ